MPRISPLLVVVVFAFANVADPAAAQTPDISGPPPTAASLAGEIRSADRIRIIRPARIQTVTEWDATQSSTHYLGKPNVILFRDVAAPKQQAGEGWGNEFALLFRTQSLEDRLIKEWAETGQTAVWFEQEAKAHVCLGKTWYRCEKGTTTGSWELCGYLGDSVCTFVGDTERLRKHVADIQAGKRVTITAEPIDESEGVTWSRGLMHRTRAPFANWVYGQKGRQCRAWISPNDDGTNQQHELSRNFVGWGIGGPEAVPQLVEALRSPKPWVRSEAAVDLGQLGKLAHSTLPKLRECLNDPNVFVRILAAQAVLRLDTTDERALPILCAELKAIDFLARATAITALAELGMHARKAVPLVLEVLKNDRHADVRSFAADALARITVAAKANDPGKIAVMSALATALSNDRDDCVRRAALRALIPLGQNAAPIVLHLEQVSKEITCEDELSVEGLLFRIGPMAIPALVGGVRGTNKLSPDRAAWALGELGPAAREAAPALLDAANTGHGNVILIVASALRKIDPEQARKVVPALKRLALKGDHSALEQLIDLGERSEELARQVMLQLGPKEREPKFYMLPLLQRLGPAARFAGPRLLAWMLDEKLEMRHRIEVADTLVHVDPSTTEFVIGFLLNNAHDGTWPAEESLRRLGPRARSVEPVLRRWLQDSPIKRQVALAELLWFVAPREEAGVLMIDRRREAMAVFLRALDSVDREAAQDALFVLERLGREAEPALPKILDIIGNAKDDLALWYPAAELVALFGPRTLVAAPYLRQRLSDPDTQVRMQAAKSLSRVAPDDQEALAALIRLETRIPGIAAEHLGRLGPRAKSAVPVLQSTLRYGDHEAFQRAKVALSLIDPGATP